jgi:hypothetical protein
MTCSMFSLILCPIIPCICLPCLPCIPCVAKEIRSECENNTIKINESEIQAEYGKKYKMSKRIPLEHVQDVSITQGCVQKYYGIHQLDVRTAANSYPNNEAALSILAPKDPEMVRDFIMTKREARVNGARLGLAPPMQQQYPLPYSNVSLQQYPSPYTTALPEQQPLPYNTNPYTTVPPVQQHNTNPSFEQQQTLPNAPPSEPENTQQEIERLRTQIARLEVNHGKPYQYSNKIY